MANNNSELITDIIVSCPHCGKPIIIEKLNCCIFRHGFVIKTGQQMNPHASKDECDNLLMNKEIWGCGKPFKIIKSEKDEYTTEICDYI
jgi:hypothetical protein